MELYRTLTGQSSQSHDFDQSKQIHQVPTHNSTFDQHAGHVGHLSPQQDATLSKFKAALYDQGLWKPGGSEKPPSHDDATLLRYLRARRFDVGGAVAQFADTEKWMKENRIDELYNGFDVAFYEQARRMYPQWTGHRDRRGIPLYVYVIKHLDSKNVSAYTKEAQKYKATLPNHSNLSTPAKMLPLFALYNNMLNFVLPLCSSLERPDPKVPISNSTNIVDISGVGLKQFWNLKGHMQEASVLATAHYPETLDRIFIIGAPSFFPTVWGWIKRWFDPVTVSKIFILGQHEVESTLTKFIDPSGVPKIYGGKLDWEFGMTPSMDEPIVRTALERDGHKGWVDGPCLFMDNHRIPVGTVKGKPRTAVLPKTSAGSMTGAKQLPNPESRKASAATLKAPVPKEPEHKNTAHADSTPSQFIVPSIVKDAAVGKDKELTRTEPAQATLSEEKQQQISAPPSRSSDTHGPVTNHEGPASSAVEESARMNIGTSTAADYGNASHETHHHHHRLHLHHHKAPASNDGEDLAAETNKLSIQGQDSASKPPMERFVTAVEGLPNNQAMNGAA